MDSLKFSIMTPVYNVEKYLPHCLDTVINQTYDNFELILVDDGMPNSLLEALAAGLPCISTDCPCGGPREVIESGENGLLVPVKDEEKLAEAMLTLLSDSTLAGKLAAEAKLRAERFRPDAVFSQWRGYAERFIN